VVHNDAVLQGLSAVPYMRKTSNWVILTIGTSLGNAHFSARGETYSKPRRMSTEQG
jgi:hypothetical protein